MMPLLALLSNFCGVLMGWLATSLVDPVSLRHFLGIAFQGVLFKDFIPPTMKTFVFGWIIGIVSCFQGMRTTGGTEGVGQAARTSVVLSSLFVILADVVLVRLILVFFRRAFYARKNRTARV